MMQSVALYWIKRPRTPLMAVAESNDHTAAKILGVSVNTLHLQGGLLTHAAHQTRDPDLLSRLYPVAIQNRGTAFIHDSVWKPMKVSVHHNQNVGGDQRKPSKKVYVLRMTTCELNAFHKAGGAKWFRKQIDEAADEDAMAPSRTKETQTHVISVRVLPSSWERYKALGGKTWLIHALAKFIKKNNRIHNPGTWA